MSDAANATRLKAAIDKGATGDKVEHLDLTTNPLGTDSEAGGTPAAQGEGSDTRGLEAQIEAGKTTDPSRTRSTTANPMGLPILLAIAAAAGLAVALWFLLT